jgi:pilus assembly protein Flp/PilA
MKSLASGIRRFLQEEDGATMVEYGLMVALIAVVCAAAVVAIGLNLNIAFGKIRDCIANPSVANCS